MHKNKLSKLASLYIVVSVFVAVLSVFSFTFAWYVKVNTASLNVKFAPPILIEINNEATLIRPLGGDLDALLPGSKIGINTGISIPEGSSNAYVRAKMSIIFEDVFEMDEEGNPVPVLWDEYVNVENAISANWILVDFSRNEDVEDLWYVCRAGAGSMISREVSPGDVITFANGTIDLSFDLDNRFADKKIDVVLVVETLQVESVADPLINGLTNAKFHEIWGSE